MALRIGIFGGTFDPIHIGHLIIGQEMLGQCDLDKVVFMPSGEPPHKHTPEMASAEDRACMTELAVADYPQFETSRFELSRPGKSYTVDTLRDLRQEMVPETVLFLIIGADNAVEMDQWCDPHGVLDLAQVLVAERPGFERERVDPAFLGKMQFVETPLLDISSTTIRQRVKVGKPITFYVPQAVANYIYINTNCMVDGGGKMNAKSDATEYAKLGGTPEGRIQRYFCVDDDKCKALARVSKDAIVVSKEEKEIMVMGETVKGWVVELEVPATDGVVRMDLVSKP